jgi:hypothetical protein
MAHPHARSGHRSQSRAHNYLAILERPPATTLLDSDDGGVVGMFEPIQMLPSQLARGAKGRDSPEKRLMVAILEDALSMLMKYHRAQHGRGLYNEARGWFLSRRTSWLYDFERICQSLDFDPDYIRRGLARFLHADA